MPHAACTICSHPDLAQIDQALRIGAPSIRTLAGLHGVSKSALDRHRKHANPAKVPVNAGQLERIDAQIKKLNRAEKAARKRRDNKAALGIARELRHWFTLRERAEAQTTAAQPQEQAMSRTEALDIAKAVVEAELAHGSQELIAWLHDVAMRFPGANSKLPEPSQEPETVDEHGVEP